MVPTSLTRQRAIDLLVASEPAIRGLGVARLALFGSVVGDEARPDSDVDLLVQFALGWSRARGGRCGTVPSLR